MTDELVNKEDVLKAYKVLRNVVKQTPLQHDAYLSQKYHANIFEAGGPSNRPLLQIEGRLLCHFAAE